MAAENNLTRAKLAEYLIDPDKFDCGISISHSTVLIKSYGKTRRYLCIPPRISLFGDGWKKRFGNPEKTSKSAAGQPSKQPTSSNASLVPSNNKSQPSKIGFKIGIDPFPALEEHSLDLSSKKKTHTVDKKVLYVTDCGKHVHASLKVSMERPAKQNPEFFPSKPMKIVPKASNRRESIKSVSNDACIRSGSTVALYSKISDYAPAQYLHVANGGFLPSDDNWSSVVIYHVLENSDPAKSINFVIKEGFVYYGAVVKLVDSITGNGLPDMRIMYVENGIVKLNQSEDQKMPVCQQNRCAFQMLDNPNNYLSIVSNKIVPAGATNIDESSHTIKTIATWNIMPTDETKYRFYEAMGPVPSPVTPVPMITGIEVVEPDRTAIEFKGSNFGAEHKFWLGLYELSRLSLEPERITCTLPTYAQVSSPREKSFTEVNGQVSFPITITRSDGVVYGTTYYFHYYKIADDNGVPAFVNPFTEFKRPKSLRRVWPEALVQTGPIKIQISPPKKKGRKSSAKSAPTE